MLGGCRKPSAYPLLSTLKNPKALAGGVLLTTHSHHASGLECQDRRAGHWIGGGTNRASWKQETGKWAI